MLVADKSGVRDLVTEKSSKMPEGAMTGASTGGVLGGALGWLVGIGALAIPGLGPFIAAGPLLAALSGAAMGAAAGGLAGGLVGLGIPEFEAKRYEGRVREGGSLIAEHCESSDEATRAKDIFEECGATDITSSGESSAPDRMDSRARPEVVVPSRSTPTIPPQINR